MTQTIARTRRRGGLVAQQGQLLSEYLEGIPEAPKGRAMPSRKRAEARKAPRRSRLDEAGLDGGNRLQIIDILIRSIEGAYCHLPQKRAAYAIDPVQALRLLRIQAAGLSEREFHLALTSIVTGLRDAHTLYSGPESQYESVAVLPFLVEQYGPHDDPTFIVSKVSSPALIPDPKFVEEVKLTHWNGIPFARAVDLYADWETGGRPDTRRARALESFTFRALEFGPPPDELWVTITYETKRGETREVRMLWRVVRPGRASTSTGNEPGSRASRYLAIDPSGELVRRAKKLMFSKDLWDAEQSRRPIARAAGWLPTSMQDVLAAREVRTATLGNIGYLRIWSFDVDDDDAFVSEMVRLLEKLPQNGLIVDLRGNPGGLIWAAERSLQLLTPKVIVPTRFSMLATPLTRAMAASLFNQLELGAWLPSLEAAISTGEAYSQPLPMTEPDWCNDVGQRYSGPVVCVVDPNTYSSGDLFAAGFVDNQIGPLVSIGEGTGAGGANVWTHHYLREALADTPFALGPLPKAVGFTMAIRRAVRSRASDGVPIEDLGIPGIPYAITRDDLFEHNKDLIEACAQLLRGNALTTMRVRARGNSISVTTSGLDELETYIDGRPSAAVCPIVDGERRLERPRKGTVDLVGRRNGQICQRRRVLPQGD